jgi:hypothetical protein
MQTHVFYAEGGPSPSTPVSGPGLRGSARGNGISQGSFRRVKTGGVLVNPSCTPPNFQQTFILTGNPHSSLVIPSIRASLTCSCAQDFNGMKVPDLKDLLRNFDLPVGYSSTLHLMDDVLGSVTCINQAMY